MGTCLHWQSSVLLGQAGALWLCRHPVRSTSSVHLPQGLHGSPGLSATNRAGRLWGSLIFNERNTEAQEVMERAECYKQPILARSQRALQAKPHGVFCQQ